MEQTVGLRRSDGAYPLRSDLRLGLRERLEGRRLAQDTIELDLRAIALQRLAEVRAAAGRSGGAHRQRR